MAAFGFTPAREQDLFSFEAEQSSSKTSSGLSGEEAKRFYESLTKDEKGGDGSKGQTRQESRESRRRAMRRVRAVEAQQGQSGGSQSETGHSERTMELLGLRLLRFAHEGDIPGLKEVLSKGVDINYQDTFFWTAVMCASWSGQRSAVRLLLQHGAAWVGVVDTKGRDAKDLALEGSHCERQWCDVCRSEHSSSLLSHLSSTLHQFNLRRPPPTPYYCLPPSSNSFKMMVRCGWKPGTGLGPQGEGPKQPVPTVLKRDQKGLGYGQMKRAKVTHFQARDCEAVKPPSKDKVGIGMKGQRKEESRKKEQKDRNWERDFRASFYL
uniref:G-patch domain and ankyrin repeats 1 n=1 Tax=Pundamilia nyererei TaxID=303518 RepID=A0A3B4H305_9CICH